MLHFYAKVSQLNDRDLIRNKHASTKVASDRIN